MIKEQTYIFTVNNTCGDGNGDQDDRDDEEEETVPLCGDIWIKSFDNVKSIEWKMAINNRSATTINTSTHIQMVRAHSATIHPNTGEICTST